MFRKHIQSNNNKYNNIESNNNKYNNIKSNNNLILFDLIIIISKQIILNLMAL